MPARQHRITRGEDYRRTVRTGRRVGGAYCITHAVFSAPDTSVAQGGTSTPARFGFIISKAVGNAVTRNLIRRRFKTIVERQLASGIAGVDIVFRVFPKVTEASFEELEAEVTRALARVTRDRERAARS
ncbi:ribonuclease P protein component [Leucobacter sp. HY1910]